jgi:diaminopimelate decarboxylase
MSNKKIYERPIITKNQAGFLNKFGSSSLVKPKSEIDGVLVKDLVNQWGSPLFVISERQIRSNQRNALRIFKSRYPKVQFSWSYKTNYLKAVCAVFHSEGSWAEVVSDFEYQKARRLGIPGEKIIFNGPDKSDKALLTAIQEGAKIHIDHFDELYRIIEITDEHKMKANVAIRVNMDVGIYPKWDRFGFNYENGEAWQALKRIVIAKNLNLIGLHTHIGTYIMSADAYRIAASKLVDLAKGLKNNFNINLEYIDMGGGFASNNTLLGQYLPAEEVIPSVEQYADAISSGLYELSGNLDELPTLILETGRALIDDAGFLITKVLANKRLSTGKRAIIIDAGVNILFTSFWYKHRIHPANETGVHTEDSAIYGPLCMNIDCIRESIVFPNVKKDDLLVIDYVGAYDMTQWMQFITMRPNVVMIMQDGSVELIRKAEDIDYIEQQEILPSKLKNL